MFIIVLGVVIGSFWGWQYALISVSAGLLFNGLVGYLSDSEEKEELYQFEDIPTLSSQGSTEDTVMNMNHTNNPSGFIDNSNSDDFDINPANGLPMIGAIDIEGNPFGTDTVHETNDNIFEDSSGIDINPANGLPMLDSIDIEGNVYGTDTSHETYDTCSYESSFDDSCDMGFDDSFCSGFDDSY
jgi:hypothetical protein